ncbi:MAG: hypothetical protein H7146_08160 [Burkholderiaceae bacterium]|nr:hypothetical protein [Microbacteriaceae bacterium]
MTSYPTAEYRRTALVPAVLAAIVLVAGSALLGTDGFVWILYPTSILALVISVFAWQAKQWWWLLVLIPLAIAWNPVLPFGFDGVVWQAAQFIAALLFVAMGVLIRVRNPDDRNRR